MLIQCSNLLGYQRLLKFEAVRHQFIVMMMLVWVEQFVFQLIAVVSINF
jgi:hypothetical protein